MNTVLRTTLASVLAVGGWVGAALPAAAADRMPDPRAVCDGRLQDREACLREFGAARQASRNGNLTSADAQDYRANALARCDLHQPAERDACRARMLGTGNTEIDGSVMGGGLLRAHKDTVILVPATPARAR